MTELTHAEQAERKAAAERAAYIRGLVELADLLDANPDIPLPYDGQIRPEMRGLTVFAGAEQLAEVLGRPVQAEVRTTHLWVEWHISGLAVTALVKVDAFEERVTGIRVIGGREVPVTEMVIPERFRPVPADTESAVTR